MCTDNLNDIPVRSLVSQNGHGWKAHCLDFDLVGLGVDPDEAVDQLEEEIVRHLLAVKNGERTLFHPVSGELWSQYYKAAEAALQATEPGHAHIDHRPLVARLVVDGLQARARSNC